MPHILLIGGHGKVAQYMTPILLSKSWTVTSMIRAADQKPAIEKLGQSHPGKLNVLLSSVEDVSTNEQAKKIVDEVKPDWIVWSAGMAIEILLASVT
jgi:dTDP-4-dehydrorhamnose reductase